MALVREGNSCVVYICDRFLEFCSMKKHKIHNEQTDILRKPGGISNEDIVGDCMYRICVDFVGLL